MNSALGPKWPWPLWHVTAKLIEMVQYTNLAASRHTFAKLPWTVGLSVTMSKFSYSLLWLTSNLQCQSPLQPTFVPMKIKIADWFTSWLEKPTLAYLLPLIIEVCSIYFSFFIFPIHLRKIPAYAHPIILAIWVALSSVFVQYMNWWPKHQTQTGWFEYFRILPSFAAMAVAVMFLIDW